MNFFINGWNSISKGAVTSPFDIIIDHFLDAHYRIETCRFEKLHTCSVFFNYRATPYRFLNKLFQYYSFGKHDHLVDLGCGKGRVYLYAALHGCPKVTGVEMSEKMVEIANRNYSAIRNKISSRVQVYNMNACDLKITPCMNIFYLFTPFHLKLFGRILCNIKRSYLAFPRRITIIFCRPDPPWIQFMDNDPIFKYKSSIKICNDLIFQLYTTEV